MKLDHLLDTVGNTPAVRIRASGLDHIELYAKLEYLNPTGSVKDRAANHILTEGMNQGLIGRDTLVVESSSGNFGLALAAACRRRGVRFRCVIDPRVMAMNELILRRLGAEIEKVTSLDTTGGYLLTRIATVQQIVKTEQPCYWVNQYANPLNAEAYTKSFVPELQADFEVIDYVFIGVSSGGTITGVSQGMREAFPKAKVVAVDFVGSVVFGGAPLPRWIPGIGASRVPPILKDAQVDDVAMVEESDAAVCCHELLERHSIFAGGSSGAVLAAVRSYFQGKTFERPPVVVTLFADRGERYADTLFNSDWCEKLLNGTLRRSVRPPRGDSFMSGAPDDLLEPEVD